MLHLKGGWELLYLHEKEYIKSKSDVVFLMTHLLLIKHGFLCVHEEDEHNQILKLSELLPEGWSSTSDKKDHSLTYMKDGNKFLLGTSDLEGMLGLNILNRGKKVTHNLTIEVDSEVQKLRGDTLSEMVPNCQIILNQIWTNLVKPAMDVGFRDIETQTDRSDNEAPNIQHVEPPIIPGLQPIPRGNPFPHGFDPLGVGQRDLNPFAPIGPGGGMLLENPRGRIPLPDRDLPGVGMLPRGAIPPGARFDPLNPLVPGRRAGPDPDHLPMPGGRFDNMFM